MLAEIGRRADFALTRATDVIHEGAHATVVHLRRILGAVSVAVVRAKREAEDLVWDYQDVAGDLRRSDGTGTDLPDDRQLPAFLRPFSRHFAGVPGTGLYNIVKNGDAEYRIYRFTKD